MIHCRVFSLRDYPSLDALYEAARRYAADNGFYPPSIHIKGQGGAFLHTHAEFNAFYCKKPEVRQ